MVCPHEHGHVLGHYHEAGEAEISMAIDAALQAKYAWKYTPWEERAAIFNRMASLISGRYRYILNAATMLGQSKTAHQAEIDSTCETADFFRYNAKFMEQIYRNQPVSQNHTWNRVNYRALEGFVLAISPFNFTAIAANLATAPAIMGNTVVWKPASTSMLSNYYLMQLYKEAGLPDGVINFVPARGSQMGKIALDHPSFAGLHFTGSTAVFNSMWQTVANNMAKYKIYPRLVGETGGKDYIFVHHSADLVEAATGHRPGRLRVPGAEVLGLLPGLRPRLPLARAQGADPGMMARIRMGDPRDFRNYMGAVIDEASFDNTMRYIELAKASSRGRDHLAAARATSRWAGSWSPPSSSPPTPSSSPWRRRSSRRCSPSTSTRTTRLDETLRAPGRDLALRPHRRHLRPGPARHQPAHRGPGQHRRQLLHQRQVHRRHGRAPALRRRPGLGHQRQGRQLPEPDPLDLAPHHQGVLLARTGISSILSWRRPDPWG